MKKTIWIIVCIMLVLSGGFFILTVNEDIKGKKYREEKAIRAKEMRKHYDEIIKLINGPKKVKMVRC